MRPDPATIVIPVLRQKDAWLRQAVESAFSQTVPCEILVVTSPRTPPSNRSTLDELARSGSRQLRLLEEPPRGGYAAALNLGIRAATTDRVGFLLSDDWLDQRAVETCLQQATDIVSTGLVIYDADGAHVLGARRVEQREFEAQPSLERKAAYLRHFFLFRKEALLEVGGVDETVGNTGPDDFDLIWTLLEHGARVAVTDAPLYYYRDHLGERLSLRASDEQLQDLAKILTKHNVEGEERRSAMERRAHSYGRPIYPEQIEPRRRQSG